MVVGAWRTAYLSLLIGALLNVASAYTPPLVPSHTRLTSLQPASKHQTPKWRHLPGASSSGIQQLGALVSKDGWAETPKGSKMVMMSKLVRGMSTWWGRQSSRSLVARKASSDATGIDGELLVVICELMGMQ